jgi:hypothetical protein
MASERAIFDQYCSVSIGTLTEKGYMKSDQDWDVFRQGELKYIYRIFKKDFFFFTYTYKLKVL